MRMRVGRRGFLKPGGQHPLPQSLRVIHLVSQVIHPRLAGIRLPLLGRFAPSGIQRNISFVRPHMHPADLSIHFIPTDLEIWKRRLQIPDHSIHVSDTKVRVFKSILHACRNASANSDSGHRKMFLNCPNLVE